MPYPDPLIVAIQTHTELNPHSVSKMLRRSVSETELKLCGSLPFNVSEVVVLSTHLGIDWRPLLSNRDERPID
jgi:hypothetical protein